MGRLGKGPSINYIYSPQIIIFPYESNKILGISVSETHCLAWDFYGYLYAWGDAYYGKLGFPPQKNTFLYIGILFNFLFKNKNKFNLILILF